MNKDFNKKIEQISFEIAKGYCKGKTPVFVTGLGISMGVGVPNLMELLIKLWLICDSKENTMVHFKEKIEDAIMDPSNFESTYTVFSMFSEGKTEDEKLVWREFSQWLLYSSINVEREESPNTSKSVKTRYMKLRDILKRSGKMNYVELLQSVDEFLEVESLFQNGDSIESIESSKEHELLIKLMNNLKDQDKNLFLITTNFDNLMSKITEKKLKSGDPEFKKIRPILPIFEPKNMDSIFCSRTVENKLFEIQSRGDMYWGSCSKNLTPSCSISKPITLYSPNTKLEERLKCECGADLDVKLYFPGSSDKEIEMSKMVEKMWKYFLETASIIVTIGISFDWDDVLIDTLVEISRSKRISFVNVNPSSSLSRHRVNREVKWLSEYFSNLEHRNYNDKMCVGDNFKYIYEKPFAYTIEAKGAVFLESLYSVLFKTITDLENKINKIKSNPEDRDFLSINNLEKASQIGLKGYWLGKYAHSHNRKEHTLEACRILSKILTNECFRNYNQYQKRVLNIAMLLHDIGHVPFSHMLEEVIIDMGIDNVKPDMFYTHEYLTEVRVHENLEMILPIVQLEGFSEVIFTVEDIINMIRGVYGQPVYDALINSPVDIDKLEYIFTDTKVVEFNTKLEKIKYLEIFSKGVSITHSNLLSFSGIATKYLITFLLERQTLYNELYYRKGLRYLESITKYILKRYFQWELSNNYSMSNSRNKFCSPNEMKVKFILDKIDILINNYENDREGLSRRIINGEKNIPNEVKILCSIHQELKNKEHNFAMLDAEYLSSLIECVVKTNSESALEEIERNKIEVLPDEYAHKLKSSEVMNKVEEIITKHHNIIALDFYYNKRILSIPKHRKYKKRLKKQSIETNIENILVTEGETDFLTDNVYELVGIYDAQNIKKENQRNERFKIRGFIYSINISSGSQNDIEFRQAKDELINYLRTVEVL